MPTEITDTERIEWIAQLTERTDGKPRGEFLAEIDAQILADRATKAPKPAWIDLTIDFPSDDTPVFVEASDEREGVVCYCSVAGDWYLYCPGKEMHGRLWSEVFGPRSEILRWHPVKG